MSIPWMITWPERSNDDLRGCHEEDCILADTIFGIISPIGINHIIAVPPDSAIYRVGNPRDVNGPMSSIGPLGLLSPVCMANQDPSRI